MTVLAKLPEARRNVRCPACRENPGGGQRWRDSGDSSRAVDDYTGIYQVTLEMLCFSVHRARKNFAYSCRVSGLSMPFTGTHGHRGSAVRTLIPLPVSCTVSSIFTPGPDGFHVNGWFTTTASSADGATRGSRPADPAGPPW